MDEKFEPIDSSQPSKPPSSGLTLVLPALSALKQKHGIKKSKHKSTLPPSHADGFGEAKKPPRPLKLKPLKEVLLKLISQIKKSPFDLSLPYLNDNLDSIGRMTTHSSCHQ